VRATTVQAQQAEELVRVLHRQPAGLKLGGAVDLRVGARRPAGSAGVHR
jgi:hypothetical protein